jgi:hypothetical protein
MAKTKRKNRKRKTKDRQYNGQNTNEGQTIQWPKQKRKTDNTIAKTKTKEGRHVRITFKSLSDGDST